MMFSEVWDYSIIFSNLKKSSKRILCWLIALQSIGDFEAFHSPKQVFDITYCGNSIAPTFERLSWCMSSILICQTKICPIFFDFYFMAHCNMFLRALHDGALCLAEKSNINTKSRNVICPIIWEALLLYGRNMVCSENLRLGSHLSIDLVNQQPIIFAFSLCLRVSMMASYCSTL